MFTGIVTAIGAVMSIERKGDWRVGIAAPWACDGIELSAALQWCVKRDLSSLLLESGTQLNHSFYSAGLIDQIIHLSAQKKLKTGVPGLLYNASTQAALAFPPDSDYIKVRSRELAGDRLSIWRKDKLMIGRI